ncbi:MAG: alpha-N-arabinofuranosidase, partial [Acidobacteria bacterium]
QLVNVIAPMATNSDGLLRHTIFYPYKWALQFARGAALNLLVESPTYDVPEMGHVPYVDVAATFDEQMRKVSLFVFNRDLSKAREVELVWEDNAPSRAVDAMTLTGDDLKAFNSFEAPQRVAPRPFEKPVTNGSRTRFEAPPRSYSVIQWSL